MTIVSINSVIAPELNRTVEKLAASMAGGPRARRQSTEFAAKATRANNVKAIVRTRAAPFGRVRPLELIS